MGRARAGETNREMLPLRFVEDGFSFFDPFSRRIVSTRTWQLKPDSLMVVCHL